MDQTDLPHDIAQAWKLGETLPQSALARYPLPEQEIRGDTGCNILLDLAHHCRFEMMWGLPSLLQAKGFRACSTHASLDTVLTPGTVSRVRTLAGKASDGKPIRPLVEWPNTEYNAVVTFQAEAGSPRYTEEERLALDAFVRAGGGLVAVAGCYGNGRVPARDGADWPMRDLVASYGAEILEETDRVSGDAVPAFADAGGGWQPMLRGEGGLPVVLSREHGKGRIVLVASLCLILQPLWTGQEESDERKAEREDALRRILAVATAGNPPVGGETRLPDTWGGAGGIYPEIEKRIGTITVFYARNQPESVLRVVEEEYPRIREQLLEWLPSPLPEDRLLLILGAGNGGGWAVNAYYPKENGIISNGRHGLIGVFAHEFAHILSGPRNAAGGVAADWFDGNQGEAHAGFFQGRIWAMESEDGELRECNKILEHEAEHGKIDFAHTDKGQYGKDKGWVWRKLWYVWQKLDDRYGTTWYPRWRWVQHTRWQHDPERKLSIDEMVEDMSIAVGEDLFPFFRLLGTTLKRDRLDRVEFNGEELSLAPAPLDDGPAGKARFEPIGDYTRPITLS